MGMLFTPDDHRKMGEPIPLVAHDLQPILNHRARFMNDVQLQSLIAAYAKTNARAFVRSKRQFYNCVGLPLADRRTAIEPDLLPSLLPRDGYREIPLIKLQTNDIIVYKKGWEYSHVAVVENLHLEPGLDVRSIAVISKWGLGPEYHHKATDVPVDLCGQPAEYWTTRTED